MVVVVMVVVAAVCDVRARWRYFIRLLRRRVETLVVEWQNAKVLIPPTAVIRPHETGSAADDLKHPPPPPTFLSCRKKAPLGTCRR